MLLYFCINEFGPKIFLKKTCEFSLFLLRIHHIFKLVRLDLIRLKMKTTNSNNLINSPVWIIGSILSNYCVSWIPSH